MSAFSTYMTYDVQMTTEYAAAKSDAVAASDTAAAGDVSPASDAAAAGDVSPASDAAAAGDGAVFDFNSYPLTILKHPIEPVDEAKKIYFRLVKLQMPFATFTNFAGFKEWFKKTLLPRIASDSAPNENIGKVMIKMTFGSIDEFMLFVLTNFTR